ncbi:hypothetical protein ACFQL1_00350 [Halomicroarcula sp. GCM10025709]|uniref:hypothetical protein n=1 Tax=Halomicroarcula sp. GCM10025709 TaxID=3252669 RepID=UPI00360875BA
MDRMHSPEHVLGTALVLFALFVVGYYTVVNAGYLLLHVLALLSFGTTFASPSGTRRSGSSPRRSTPGSASSSPRTTRRRRSSRASGRCCR